MACGRCSRHTGPTLRCLGHRVRRQRTADSHTRTRTSVTAHPSTRTCTVIHGHARCAWCQGDRSSHEACNEGMQHNALRTRPHIELALELHHRLADHREHPRRQRRHRRTLRAASTYCADLPVSSETTSAVSLPGQSALERSRDRAHAAASVLAVPVVVRHIDIGAGEDESG